MIRQATLNDAAIIAKLNGNIQLWHAQNYPEAFFPHPPLDALTQHFTTRLGEPDVICLLAGDPPLGYALCSLQNRPLSIFSPPVKRLLVEHIAVEPQARRQGLGRKLLQSAKDLAKEHSCDEVILDTWAANAEAHDFFREMGFAPRRMLFHAKA